MHRERCPRALAITETQERLRHGTRLGKRKRLSSRGSRRGTPTRQTYSVAPARAQFTHTPARWLTPVGSKGPDDPEGRLEDVHRVRKLERAQVSLSSQRVRAGGGPTRNSCSDSAPSSAQPCARTSWPPAEQRGQPRKREDCTAHLGQVQERAKLTTFAQAATAKQHRQGGS